MAMGKRRQHAKQARMWVATQDLPWTAGHPFYARLNHILDRHDFDEYVEELCERFYADEVGRPRMRRVHLRGHTNILKRLLIHIGGFNLGLLMRQLVGIGTPRGLQGRLNAVVPPSEADSDDLGAPRSLTGSRRRSWRRFAPAACNLARDCRPHATLRRSTELCAEPSSPSLSGCPCQSQTTGAVDDILRLRYLTDPGVASVPQAVLADFIDGGDLARHIRKTRRLHAERLSVLRVAAARDLNGALHIPTIDAGLATPAFYDGTAPSRDIESAAGARGVEALALDRFVLRRPPLRGSCLASRPSTSLPYRATCRSLRRYWNRQPVVRGVAAEVITFDAMCD